MSLIDGGYLRQAALNASAAVVSNPRLAILNRPPL